MVRPDSSEPRRVLDEPPPSDATQSKQRIIQRPLLRHSHVSMTPSASTARDLEIEKMLDEVLEQVRLATSATAAAIALKAGEEMICRAAAGPNAPDVGVRLDVSSGLSGACVRTREIQYCEDTETDSRVNAAASRRLQVRSVLVVPLLAGSDLLGVFEIFSPYPGAFGNRDLQNLQTLAQAIVENLRVPEGTPPPSSAIADFSSVTDAGPEAQVERSISTPTSVKEEETSAPEGPRAAVAAPQEQEAKPGKVVQAAASSPIAGWPSAPAETPVFLPPSPRRLRARTGPGNGAQAS